MSGQRYGVDDENHEHVGNRNIRYCRVAVDVRFPAWCASSGYDNGPPRERGPGTGPFWAGEPTDCESIWRHGHYRGTDPDPNIRRQLMRGR